MEKQQKTKIRLGRLELEIMNVVWDQGAATVQEVKDALAGKKSRAYSTILTMMRKLEHKSFLEHDVDGRTFVYRPCVKRRAVRRELLGDLVERLFDGSPSLLVTSLVEGELVDEDELREITKLLSERRTQK